MTAKDYIFYKKIMHGEKYSKTCIHVYTVSGVVDPSREVPDLNWEVEDLLFEVGPSGSQTRGAGSEIS